MKEMHWVSLSRTDHAALLQVPPLRRNRCARPLSPGRVHRPELRLRERGLQGAPGRKSPVERVSFRMPDAGKEQLGWAKQLALSSQSRWCFPHACPGCRETRCIQCSCGTARRVHPLPCISMRRAPPSSLLQTRSTCCHRRVQHLEHGMRRGTSNSGSIKVRPHCLEPPVARIVSVCAIAAAAGECDRRNRSTLARPRRHVIRSRSF